MKMSHMDESWQAKFAVEFTQPYMEALQRFLQEERLQGIEIYPPQDQLFAAFSVPFHEVKVVIVGQDPYHGMGQAHGLAFSVPQGIAIPPSLQNIFKEIQSDLSIPPPSHGCLTSWAQQGVLLLNATLTVRASLPKSHDRRGWELLTDRVLEWLFQRTDPIVFVLWGKSALAKCKILPMEATHHLLLTAAHPSPFSAHHGFFGCRHFSQINAFLKQHGKTAIDWSLRSDPTS